MELNAKAEHRETRQTILEVAAFAKLESGVVGKHLEELKNADVQQRTALEEVIETADTLDTRSRKLEKLLAQTNATQNDITTALNNAYASFAKYNEKMVHAEPVRSPSALCFTT